MLDAFYIWHGGLFVWPIKGLLSVLEIYWCKSESKSILVILLRRWHFFPGALCPDTLHQHILNWYSMWALLFFFSLHSLLISCLKLHINVISCMCTLYLSLLAITLPLRVVNDPSPLIRALLCDFADGCCRMLTFNPPGTALNRQEFRVLFKVCLAKVIHRE